MSRKIIKNFKTSKIYKLLLALCISLMVSIETIHATNSDEALFANHMKKTIEVSDDVSSRKMRKVRLYSRVTSKHVQILGKKIAALGDESDQYTQLLFISDSLGGRIRIQGEKSRYYLCTTPRGKLVGRKRFQSNRCTFKEGYTVNYYNTFSSVQNHNWYISFNRRGRPKRGPRTSTCDVGSFFVKRNPPKPTQKTTLDEALIKKFEQQIREKYHRTMYERSMRRIRRHRFASETPKWTRQTVSTNRREEPPDWLFTPASDMSPQVKMEWLRNVDMLLDLGEAGDFPTPGPYIQQFPEKKIGRKQSKKSKRKKTKNKSPKRKRKKMRKSRVDYTTKSPRATTPRTFTELWDNLREKLDDSHVLNVPKTHKLFNSTIFSSKSRKRNHSKHRRRLSR